ncbi:hypothetical protein [Capnocytophaga sp. oral taxon 323]|uniref:hypothetical protein n=1 Tax=Capnocytophaga sp. oral taxon 323 TaxID=1705617 RepID=UPI0006ADD74C|nr:hypothetical protein [Capnocytophaga sp. oral taxon 323]ALC96868.1 hypothetical protein AM608_04025 [Capnocytophaga sp. oral taxon 323]
MKKLILLAFVLQALQSCSVTNTFTFHKDATISTDMAVDMSEMLAMQAKAKQGENSLKNVNMPEFPKEWQSVYDFQKTVEKDSIPADKAELLKRAAIKGLFKDNKEVGFQVRFDHFAPEEYASITAAIGRGTRNNNPLSISAFKWDGKELRINIAALEQNTDDEEQAERVAQMKKMFNIDINNTLVFEGKIKKIKGKHPYIEKIDAHTVKIDLKAADGKKKKRRDKEIIIVIK